MFILEDYISRGIGKKLLQEFIKWSKWSTSKKADRVKVVASAQNMKAIKFYQREGFTKTSFVLEKRCRE